MREAEPARAEVEVGAGRWREEAEEAAAKAEKATEAVEEAAAADAVAHDLAATVERCVGAAEARMAEAQVVEAKQVAEARTEAAEETANTSPGDKITILPASLSRSMSRNSSSIR